MSWTNHDALHRHACHAYSDFRALRKRLHDVGTDELWRSLSHHLRHVVYRSGHEVSTDRLRIKDVRRSHVRQQH
jgi:hypothetical protein